MQSQIDSKGVCQSRYLILVALLILPTTVSAQCDDDPDINTFTVQKCFFEDNVCGTPSQTKCADNHDDCEMGCYDEVTTDPIGDTCDNSTFYSCEPLDVLNTSSFFWNCSNTTTEAPGEETTSSTLNFAIGAILAFIGSTGESLGFTFMKLAHDREHKRALDEKRKERFYLCNKEWWAAMAVFTVGNILDFVAFSMTGQTIVILVGCWALCVNLITAPKILKEKRRLIDLISILIIFTGIGLAVGGSSHTDREWTTEQLVNRYADPASAITLAVVFIICITSFTITRLYHRKNPMDAHVAVQLHIKQELEKKGGKEVELDAVDSEAPVFVPPPPPSYIRTAHVILAAFTAVLTVCSAKASSEMLFQSFNACLGSQFTGPGVIIILVFIASIVLQLHFIQTSLMVNDALFHIPVFYVFWQIGSTVTGGVLYLEFDGLEYWSFILFAAGVCFLLFGIKLASARLAEVEAVLGDDEARRGGPSDDDGALDKGNSVEDEVDAVELKPITERISARESEDRQQQQQPLSPFPRPITFTPGKSQDVTGGKPTEVEDDFESDPFNTPTYPPSPMRTFHC
eukprot:m.161492 g.161492  ORF g.161492 m.161492 type:complete len:572 (+) comp31238_c0_seq5:402-2117(+)